MCKVNCRCLRVYIDFIEKLTLKKDGNLLLFSAPPVFVICELVKPFPVKTLLKMLLNHKVNERNQAKKFQVYNDQCYVSLISVAK